MDSSSLSLVQEVAGHGVPPSYIHKNGFPPAEEVVDAHHLLVDFSRLSSRKELQKLRSSLTRYGCFQLVNHGVDTELLDKALDISKAFFSLPLAEKMKSYVSGGTYTGYGNDDVLWENKERNWNDRLYLGACQEEDALPESPPDLRPVFCELAKNIKHMPKILIEAMARSLGLQEDVFLQAHGLDGVFTMKVNFYPRCPNPDKVLGIKPHQDGTTFTLLLQDQDGLQFKVNDTWFKVPVIPGALFFNVGDFMEIMSNGELKSTLHRVVTNSEKERVSIALFYTTSVFKEVEPVEELITTDRPRRYKTTNIIKYAEVHTKLNPKGKRTLPAFMM